MSNLRNLAIAMTSFETAQRRLPASGNWRHDASLNSSPNHTWAVTILPYVEQSVLYHKWNFDQPLTDRDGPNNKHWRVIGALNALRGRVEYLDAYIIGRHIFPQLIPVLTVVGTLQVAQMILQETALSFLGLGLPPPTATWGNMLAEGRDRLFAAPWIANFSGLAIILVVWGINMLGNGLREQLDPKSRTSRLNQ